MQSRVPFVLRRCSKTGNYIYHHNKESYVIRRSNVRALHTNQSNGIIRSRIVNNNSSSVNNTIQTCNKRRQRFQSQNEVLRKNNGYSSHEFDSRYYKRYIQTSSSAYSNTLAEDEGDGDDEIHGLFHDDDCNVRSKDEIGMGEGRASSLSSSLHNEVLTSEDQVMKVANANIQRLLQEEMLSIELGKNKNDILQNDESSLLEDSNYDDNHHKDIDKLNDEAIQLNIQQSLQLQQQQQLKPNSTINNKSNKKKTMTELLKKFDSTKPPCPKTTPLPEIQQWFECASQQESVEKYEAMINAARDRQDYTSLSIVQKNMLRWYGPLRKRIIQEQEAYFGQKTKGVGANKYGPYLCTLQAEKLAILTTHEATMFSLMKGDVVTLVTMAMKIGDAVEAEVNVQKLLKKRLDQKKDLMKDGMVQNDGDEQEKDSKDDAATESETSEVKGDKKNKKKSEVHGWMYGPSHLQRFVEELNRSDPGRKGKVRIQRANRRAMKLLESVEPWPSDDKVALGVVLIKMLLETAKVQLRDDDSNMINNYSNGIDGNDDDDGSQYGVPAFVYEKKWLNENNLVGCVTMNEDFYKMVVEDKFHSLDAFTTRHKPMVIPPADWTRYNDGGYMVLETDFMRTKGCQLQKVRIICIYLFLKSFADDY